MARRPSDKATERRRARGGFTLAEMMVAVGILIVVIAATAKIFGTVSKVTGIGIAGADVLQEAAAIERQLRADFERLAPEGFFAIRCVAVPNDVTAPGPLLNPALPAGAFVRADQLLFFTNGVQGTQVYAASAGSNRKQQAAAARTYYGHGFQLPDAGAGLDAANDVFPWFTGTVPLVGGGLMFMAPTPARQWLLARQVVLLADDGGSTDFYLSSGANSAATIWDRLIIRNSRRDIAASQLNDIRASVLDADGNGAVDPWLTQRLTIGSAVFYPRAERVAPSMDRLDHALTTNVLASACSSFIIDWTFANGVGFSPNPNNPGRPFLGVGIVSAAEQPWFGMADAGEFLDNGNVEADDERGVLPFSMWTAPGVTIFPGNIETMVDGDPVFVQSGVVVYEAIFGYNQDTPLDFTGNPHVSLGYTPWPTAVRITMTLHDTDTRLEAGRVVQFVIDLPKRVE